MEHYWVCKGVCWSLSVLGKGKQTNMKNPLSAPTRENCSGRDFQWPLPSLSPPPGITLIFARPTIRGSNYIQDLLSPHCGDTRYEKFTNVEREKKRKLFRFSTSVGREGVFPISRIFPRKISNNVLNCILKCTYLIDTPRHSRRFLSERVVFPKLFFCAPTDEKFD